MRTIEEVIEAYHRWRENKTGGQQTPTGKPVNVSLEELEAWQADCQRLKEKVGELQAELSEWNFADAITAGEFTKAKTTRLPEIICLCGSTKFKEQFLHIQKNLTWEGKIVLSVGWFGHTDGMPSDREKNMLDELHKRKIDLADRVFVVNVGGYVGDSTKSEIQYALKANKPIAWLEPDKAWRGHE